MTSSAIPTHWSAHLGFSRRLSGSAIDKPRDTTGGDVDIAAEFFHNLTTDRFLRLGVLSLVYLRSCMVEGDLAYAIHSADGALISVVEDIDAATMLASDYGMAVAAVH
jgi:hypothetical protein